VKKVKKVKKVETSQSFSEKLKVFMDRYKSKLKEFKKKLKKIKPSNELDKIKAKFRKIQKKLKKKMIKIKKVLPKRFIKKRKDKIKRKRVRLHRPLPPPFDFKGRRVYVVPSDFPVDGLREWKCKCKVRTKLGGKFKITRRCFADDFLGKIFILQKVATTIPTAIKYRKEERRIVYLDYVPMKLNDVPLLEPQEPILSPLPKLKKVKKINTQQGRKLTQTKADVAQAIAKSFSNSLYISAISITISLLLL